MFVVFFNNNIFITYPQKDINFIGLGLVVGDREVFKIYP